MIYKIGHGAYAGANGYRKVNNKHLAVMVLIERGVSPEVARQKVGEAEQYPHPHVTMTTSDGLNVIELVVTED